MKTPISPRLQQALEAMKKIPLPDDMTHEEMIELTGRIDDMLDELRKRQKNPD